MQLTIVDPSLEARSNHHYFYCAALAKEAAARGWSVIVIGNERFPFGEIEGTKVLRHFRSNGYPARSPEPVRGYYDDFKSGNDTLFEDLIRLPNDLFPAGGLVLFPTVTEFQLYACVRWAESFPAVMSPQFIAWLMLQSGVELTAGGDMSIVDPVRALFYRLAMDRAKPLGGRVAFYGSGETHAAQYQALSGLPVAPHPLLMSATPAEKDEAPKDDEAGRGILLYAGDAKADKGLALVPDLAAHIRKAHGDWRPKVHANFTTAWGPTLDLKPAIDKLGLSDRGIEVTLGMIPAERYTRLFTSSAIVVLPYDPDEYRLKSSGVLWETIAMGLPVVVPAGTWLESEVKRWHGVYESYDVWTVEAIAAAIDRLIPRSLKAASELKQAAARFAAQNSPKAALDQLGDAWLKSAWLRSDLWSQRDIHFDTNVAGAKGWHEPEQVDGRRARWLSSKPVTIPLELPVRKTWLVKLSGPRFVSEAAVASVSVTIDDMPVQGSAHIEPDWSGWRYTGVFVPSGTKNGPHILRVVVPASTTAPGERRELGVMLSDISVGDPTEMPPSGAPMMSCPVVFTRGQAALAKPVNGEPVYRLGAAAGGSVRPPAGDALVFRCHAVGAAQRVMESLKVTFNGIDGAIHYRPADDGFAVTAPVPAAALLARHGRVDVEIASATASGGARLLGGASPLVVRNPRIERAGSA